MTGPDDPPGLARLTEIAREQRNWLTYSGCTIHSTFETWRRLLQLLRQDQVTAPSLPTCMAVDRLTALPVVLTPTSDGWDWQLRRGDQVIEQWPPAVSR